MDQRNTFGHGVVWMFLITTLFSMSAMSSSLKKQLESDKDKITLQPYELFARKDVSGQGGIYKFLGNEDDKAQGINNVDKGRLPSNELFIFNEISVNYSKGATGKVGTSTYNTPLPGELRNCEFQITQNGRDIVNLPLASLSNPFDGNNTQDFYTTLGSLAYIMDDTGFEVYIKFPNGVSLPAGEATNFHYLEVRLRGHRTIRKAA